MAEPIAREARSRGLLRVRVDRVAPEGEGIGRVASSEAAPSAGKVVFVPHALPGEAVDAAVLREKSQYVRGRLMAVAEPSPSRVPPRCPHHFRPGLSEYCGGCDWQQASYEKQLELKRAIVEDCMARIATLRVPVEAVLPSPFQWRYRNKVQVPFQPLPPPRLLAAGFYSPGSHRIVEFEDCVVQPELSVRVVRTVRDMARRFAWPIYDEKTGRGWLRHLFLRTNGEGRALAALVTRTPAFPKEKEAVLELTRRHPEIASLWQNVQMEKTSVILGPRWRKLYGSDRFVEKVGNVSLELSPGAFLQVNTPAAEILYRTAEELLFEGGFRPNLVLDLYSGAGVIALWIAPKVGRVIGVEESREAVADAYATRAAWGCGISPSSKGGSRSPSGAWGTRARTALGGPSSILPAPAATPASCAFCPSAKSSAWSTSPATPPRSRATPAAWRIPATPCAGYNPWIFSRRPPTSSSPPCWIGLRPGRMSEVP